MSQVPSTPMTTKYFFCVTSTDLYSFCWLQVNLCLLLFVSFLVLCQMAMYPCKNKSHCSHCFESMLNYLFDLNLSIELKSFIGLCYHL